MTTETRATTSNSALGVPIAIVLAGGLIALAIYFGGQNPGQAVVTNPEISVTPTPEIAYRPITDDDHSRGPAQARVTILEYSDLECPFCKQFHPTVHKLLEAYPNDVRWVYRHYPIAELHSKAPAESIASECAGEQGKFWEFIDKVYEVTPANDGLDLSTLPTLARQVGVADITAFTNCISSTKYDEVINADILDAQQAGATGTPYSLIIGPDGKKVPVTGAQSLDYLKSVVDTLLKS